MKTLVVVSHDLGVMSPQMLSVVSAIQKVFPQYDGVVLGNQCQPVADQAAQLPGMQKVFLMQDEKLEHFLAESMVSALLPLVKNYDTVIFASSTFSKNILPRLAVKMDISPITDVSEIVDEKTYKRPIYAGNAVATVVSEQKMRILSIRTASFLPVEISKSGKAQLEDALPSIENKITRFVRLRASDKDKPDLCSAKIVVSGGRGLGSAKNFAMVEELAENLGAAVGASRAAVDAGFVPNDYQVGQTGKIISPDIYLAVGISGAVQHLAGMKDSRIIIAIDKDEDAPIFQVADYGLVADLFEAVPAIQAYLKAQK